MGHKLVSKTGRFFLTGVIIAFLFATSCGQITEAYETIQPDHYIETLAARDATNQARIDQGTPASLESAKTEVATVLEENRQIFQRTVQFVGLMDEIQPYLSANPILPDNVEIGFTPKYIPVRIAVDKKGNLLIYATAMLVTDIGVFDVTASKNVISQRKDPLLIIQIDDKVQIYELKPNNGEKFVVEFSDNDSVYRIIKFEQEANGNIVLFLTKLATP